MGFFDKIVSSVKKGITNAVTNKASNEAEKKTGGFLDGIFGNKNDNSCEEKDTAYKSGSNSSREERHVSTNLSPKAMPDYFNVIIRENFANYEINTNVPSSSLFGKSGARNYSYTLSLSGKVCACVMLTDHNRDNNVAFKNAKAFCAENNVPFINFYTHFPNEKDYVVERIRQAV